MYRRNNDSSTKREQLIHRRTNILWNSMYLYVRERVRVCLPSERSLSFKICASFCVVSMALSILCKTNKLAFEQVRGVNKHSRRDLEDFLPSQLPRPAKRKRKCVEEPAHLGCRTWARGRNFPRESVSLVAGRCGHTIGIDVQWTGSDSIVTYIQNNSHNIHTTGELLLQNALYYRIFEVQQQNSNPTPQVVEN